ncbi:MAG: adenylate/guanylate cyclase domain-containing protein [candidate division KSB1 bacterium]|nr:adenylate/guanylate cyclase domain-containing protein [candidate division KSB1 bacterium]
MFTKLPANVLKGLLFGVLSALVVIGVTEILAPDIFDKFEAKTLDWRYQRKIEKLWEKRKGATIDDIIIVDIDDRSLEKLGRFEHWPRSYHARIIDYLSSAGAKAIGFDILFMEQGKDSLSDQLLVQAVKKAGNVYLAMSFSNANPDAFLYTMKKPPTGLEVEKLSYQIADSTSNELLNLDRFDGKFIELYNSSAGIGFANFFTRGGEDESVIRTMPLFINFASRQYPSFPMALVLGVLGARETDIYLGPKNSIALNIINRTRKSRTIKIPVDQEGSILINYMGAYRTFRFVPYYDVLEKRLPGEFFNNRIVLVGATAAGLYEWRPVPFQTAFPGVEIHANIIFSILNQNFLIKVGPATSTLILFLLTALIALPAVYLRPHFSIILTVLVAGLYGLNSIFMFTEKGVWTEEVRPLLGIMLSYLVVVTYRFIHEEKSKKLIKNMFHHYLSATVVNELLKNRDRLKPGGKRTVATAFFSDIKNFTTIAETMEAEELVSMLNEYLSAMTDIVLKYNGYLDKYEGDAIMAVFGIPLEQEDHAWCACLAAMEMQHRLVELRLKWQSEARPKFEARIGINSGSMIAGNIGGEKRVDYTVIGDSVNLASRLEGSNKIYNTNIIISEDTYKYVRDKVIVRELDYIRVKGKHRPVRVYELLAKAEQGIDEKTAKVLEYFAQGLKIYREGNWERAYNQFIKALQIKPDDGPSQEFFRRCKLFIEEKKTVPPNWDGVFEIDSK